MKNLVLIMSLSFLLVVAACGSNEVNGKGPEDIPVEWATAMIQKDQAKRLELLDDETATLNPKKGPENDEKLEKYRLTEWKASEDKYFYKIEFNDPIKNEMKTETMEIVKTDSGWKRTKFLNLNNFDSLVKDMKPEVIKELK
ncbi:hypothetical protein [Metabacillus idriensis]|uniref:hypothetical protein n=1 Tax=Metabacillus idriensis TaxID=324768 RepID=UPI00174BF8FD|nr:hypothetical protein [Metabacillus idriensis]